MPITIASWTGSSASAANSPLIRITSNTKYISIKKKIVFKTPYFAQKMIFLHLKKWCSCSKISTFWLNINGRGQPRIPIRFFNFFHSNGGNPSTRIPIKIQICANPFPPKTESQWLSLIKTNRLKDVVEDCADTEQGGNPKQHLFRENMRVKGLKIHSDGQPEMWRSRRRLPEFLSLRTEGCTSLLQHCCNESLLSR